MLKITESNPNSYSDFVTQKLYVINFRKSKTEN